MRFLNNRRGLAVLLMLSFWALLGGCAERRRNANYQAPPPARPLGSLSDPIWQTQEINAEASKFVVYQHEFTLNGVRLNTAGEDHIKRIAAELERGTDFPVVIERSNTSPRQNTTYKYPVHPNPELDMQRREVVVRSLTAMGVPEADQRVSVALAYVAPYTNIEAERAYIRGIMSGGIGSGFGGFGGGFGGFGGGAGGIGGGF
jgi:hypothetical protein